MRRAEMRAPWTGATTRMDDMTTAIVRNGDGRGKGVWRVSTRRIARVKLGIRQSPVRRTFAGFVYFLSLELRCGLADIITRSIVADSGSC